MQTEVPVKKELDFGGDRAGDTISTHAMHGQPGRREHLTTEQERERREKGPGDRICGYSATSEQ